MARLLWLIIIIDGSASDLLTAELMQLGLLLQPIEAFEVSITTAVLLLMVLTHPLSLYISLASVFR